MQCVEFKRTALELLKQESSTTIRAWISQNESIADTAAVDAITNADSQRLDRVAATYPLTHTAFKIHCWQIQQAFDRGEFRLAAILLNRLEQDYPQSVLPYAVTPGRVSIEEYSVLPQ